MATYSGADRLPHAVVVLIQATQMKELAEWLESCVTGRYVTRPPVLWLRTMRHSYPGTYTGTLDVRVVIALEKASDAVLVKLTWA